MSEGKRLSRESMIYVAGEFLSKSFTFLLLPVLTRHLTLNEFAVYSVIAMIWPFLLIVFGRTLSGYIMRGVHDFEDSRRFFGSVLFYSMAAGVVLALGFHAAGPWLFDRVFQTMDYQPFLQYGLFIALFRLFFSHVLSVYRALRRAKESVQLSVIQFMLHGLFVLAAIFVFKSGLRGILNAQLVAYALTAVIFFFRVRPLLGGRFESRVIAPAFHFAAPLYIHALASWTIVYVSRIFIERSMPVSSLAVFAVATQIGFIVTVINNGLNQAWLPFVYANGDREDFGHLFSVNARKLIIGISLLCAGLLMFSPEFLLILGKSAYRQALSVLPLLMAANWLQLLYFIYISVIMHYKKTKIMPLISFSSGLLGIAVNAILIPRIGLYGAGLATLASFFLMFFIAYGLARRYLSTNVWNKALILFILSLALMVWICLTVFDSLPLLAGMALKGVIMLAGVLALQGLGLFQWKEFISMLRGHS